MGYTSFKETIEAFVGALGGFIAADDGVREKAADDLKAATGTVVGSFLVEVVNGPVKIANALGDVAAAIRETTNALQDIRGHLKSMAPELDTEGRKWPTKQDELMERLVKAVEHYNEKMLHTVR